MVIVPFIFTQLFAPFIIIVVKPLAKQIQDYDSDD